MTLPEPDDRIVACKISHAHEPSAVIICRRVERLTDQYAEGQWLTRVSYEVPLVERMAGGSSHGAIAELIADLVADAQEERANRVSVVGDITVPGVPFLKLLRQRKVRAAPVMVGDQALTRADPRLWYLPARELVSIALLVVGEGRLALAPGEHAQKMAEQLEAYRTKAPPRDALSDWRPAQHDDLARALMIATWWGERMLRSIVRQPPAPRPSIDPARPPTFDQALAATRKDRRRRARAS